MEDTNTNKKDAKIGEITSASVLSGLVGKLILDNPEDLMIGYPVIVEGKKYDFYCIVHDIVNRPTEIADMLAGNIPDNPMIDDAGKMFYSIAKLRPIQLINKSTGKLAEPETIPPYFSVVRHATQKDVEMIYTQNEHTSTIGTLRGITKFRVSIDFKKLVEKPFGIFGRTGTGKSILNKIVCTSIIEKNVASTLIFDMQNEYGLYSDTDNSEGLKLFFPDRVEIFRLDEKPGYRSFVIDRYQISPEDLIVAFHDLSDSMIDAIYEINRQKGILDLISMIDKVTIEDLANRVHESTLNALRRRINRIKRFDFVKSIEHDGFHQLLECVKQHKSVVLQFGHYGTDPMAYLFIANIISRRLYTIYTEHNEEYPKLVIFLEEAHKFLSPDIINHTIFAKLARETRKFNLILSLIDQRPAKIDEEVRSQLANRFILSLKEPSDVSSALVGVHDKSVWENIVSTIPNRTVVLVGDAVRVPTVIEIMRYNVDNVKRHILKTYLKPDVKNLDLDELIR